jgi:hypothetical protein
LILIGSADADRARVRLTATIAASFSTKDKENTLAGIAHGLFSLLVVREAGQIMKPTLFWT